MRKKKRYSYKAGNNADIGTINSIKYDTHNNSNHKIHDRTKDDAWRWNDYDIDKNISEDNSSAANNDINKDNSGVMDYGVYQDFDVNKDFDDVVDSIISNAIVQDTYGSIDSDTEDDIMIDNLNDLAVQLQWARPDGKERQGMGNGGRRRRARKGRIRKKRIQDDNGRTGVTAAEGGAEEESLPAGRMQEKAAERNAVSRVTRKMRRRRKRRALFSVFLCLLVLAALTGCFVLIMENRKLHDEVQAAMAYVDEVNSITTYTEEEVRKMTADAAAEAAERSSMEKEKEILDDIRARMENGDGTAPMLRAVYKDELVVADDGRYYFFPIMDTLKHHSYQADQFQMNDEDILEYFVDGNVASKKGIDVSRYQGKIDWKKVAGDGVEYAFIRLGIRGSSEGKLVLDTAYDDNMEGALKNDVAVGVYFFTQALNKEEAVEEAEFVLEHLDGYDVAYPVVLDVEDVATNDPRTEGMTQQDWTDVCIAFCDRIRDAGYTPMIYGNLKTFLLMVDLEQLEEYEKWFAFYQTPLYFPYEFSVWQYTSTGSVDGIKGDVDMNVSMKDWGSE